MMTTRRQVLGCRSKVGESVALIDAAITILRQTARAMRVAPEVSDALMNFFTDQEVRLVYKAAQNRVRFRINRLRSQSRDFDDGRRPDDITERERAELLALLETARRTPQFDPWEDRSMDIIHQAAEMIETRDMASLATAQGDA